jgi:hypothetical protein
MSTITEIATQIAAILDAGVADIESTELDSYLPTVRTATVALVIPPLGLSGRVAAPVGLKTRLTSRIPCKLWVKLNNKDLPAIMTRARDICLTCAAELQATATQGGVLNGINGYFGDDDEGNNAFEWTLDEAIMQLGNDDFLLGTLYVTVTEWVVLAP